MSTTPDRFNYLFSRYTSNQCTRAELQELFDQFRKMEPESVHPYMDSLYENISPGSAVDKIDWDELYEKITEEQQPVRRLFTLKKIAVAASILAITTTAAWYLLSRSDKNKTSPPFIAATTDIPPGRDVAMLTLADGTQVMLDSTANGHIAEQGGIRILKQADGELNYLPQNGQSNAAGMLNTLSTPRGGHYRLTLPDGSKVWLNAASSIRYPAAFNNKERRVEITGEAYFEVAKFRNLPFYVQSPNGEIQVLGTKFNVNAYANEPVVTTTLLEGKIGLTTSFRKTPVILEPGNQAVYPQGNSSQPDYLNEIKIQKADTGPVIAWTQNAFVFSNTSLAVAMRQIERWYDVDVVMKGDLANEAIMANLSRDIPISRVMHKLSLTGHLHFTIEGKRIIVTR
jgi:ferric-dicitrate binding protein FerR (iron transport regulator)